MLGLLQVVRDGVEVFRATARKPRLVLAALLSEPDRPVPTEWLADVVWGQHPPRSARRNVQLYMHIIRTGIGTDRVISTPHGYAIAAEGLDSIRFERQAQDGIALLSAGNHHAASELLRSALDLWRGNAFAEFVDNPLIAPKAMRLEQIRLAVQRAWFEAELRLGHHANLLAELHDAALSNPFDEELCHSLMLAQYRSGRQTEALEQFRLTRIRLIDELGVEPGLRLQELHRQILAGDPQLNLRVPANVPRQLPASSTEFVGRTEHFATLDTLVRQHESLKSVVISGMAGIGKTSLAVGWGRINADHFPDGQLHVNLHTFGPAAPMPAGEALAHFLRALGVSGSDMPASTDGRAGMFQTLIHDRRMLILLDDAASADQVRPLLPATPGCLTIITSRQTLAGLTATHGTCRLPLDLLTAEESVELLSRIIGPSRVRADEMAVQRIASLCGRLPLALGIAAAAVADQPQLSLASYARELASQSTLDTLQIPGDERHTVRAALSSSCDRLDAAARHLLRMLGAGYSTTFSTETAASATATSVEDVRRNLAELQRMHLIAAAEPGRYSMHDLIYQYAAELASQTGTPQAHMDAAARAVDHFSQSSYAASLLIEAHTIRLLPSAILDGVITARFADTAEATDWMNAEHPNLPAVVAFANKHGWLHQVTQIVVSWNTFLARQGYLTESLSLFEVALSAAEQLDDLPAHAAAARGLANTHILLGQLGQALPYAENALATYKRLGDPTNQGHTHLDLSVIHGGTGDSQVALTQAQAAQQNFRLTGNRRGQANASNNAGWYLAELGQYDAGLAACEEAYRINDETGDLQSRAYTLDSIAYIHGLKNDWHKAISAYQAAIQTFERINDRINVAVTHEALGDAYEATGASEAARSTWKEALTILEQLNHPKAIKLHAKLSTLPA